MCGLVPASSRFPFSLALPHLPASIGVAQGLLGCRTLRTRRLSGTPVRVGFAVGVAVGLGVGVGVRVAVGVGVAVRVGVGVGVAPATDAGGRTISVIEAAGNEAVNPPSVNA